MADARLALAAVLAALLLAATHPGAARAQSQPDQEQPQEEMPASVATKAPGSMPERYKRIDLPQPPVITMTAVPGYGPAPLTVGFFVNTVDPDGKGFVSYVWNFGDGQVSMDPPLTFFHTYSTPGTYVATVNATTADGRTATGYVGVTVRPALAN
ncbi:MAG TPA: PKD domain-containing protein [Candidatus Binataceae bacterium]|jgi:PKD repeat protein|nr:PKD domain-containing protein [Candidatus Binataceae bacterium]